METCDHVFLDSNNCAKCGVAYSVIQMNLISKLTVEVAKLKSELSACQCSSGNFQDALTACEKASGFVAKDLSLPFWIAQIRKDRDQAEAKCAEMQDWIRSVAANHEGYCAECNQIEHAENCTVPRLLSSDFGRGWKSPEDWDKLEARCHQWQDAFERAVKLLSDIIDNCSYTEEHLNRFNELKKQLP